MPEAVGLVWSGTCEFEVALTKKTVPNFRLVCYISSRPRAVDQSLENGRGARKGVGKNLVKLSILSDPV